MYTFADLPPHSRVWIYQADEEFTAEQTAHIQKQAELFLQNWAAHGTPLKAAIDVLHNRFIIIMVDEEHAKATGCSIDKSMHLIKQLQQELNISLLNRLQVAYKTGENITTFPSHQINELLNAGTIADTTIIFNNTVTTKQEWETNWQMPLKDSWLQATV